MKLSTDHTSGQRAVCGSTICTPIRLLGIDRGAVFVIKVFRIHSPLIFRNKAQQLKCFLKPKELVGGGILVDDGIVIAVDLPAEPFLAPGNQACGILLAGCPILSANDPNTMIIRMIGVYLPVYRPHQHLPGY